MQEGVCAQSSRKSSYNYKAGNAEHKVGPQIQTNCGRFDRAHAGVIKKIRNKGEIL